MVHRNSSEGFFLDASRHILEAPQHGLERRHLEANQNVHYIKQSILGVRMEGGVHLKSFFTLNFSTRLNQHINEIKF